MNLPKEAEYSQKALENVQTMLAPLLSEKSEDYNIKLEGFKLREGWADLYDENDPGNVRKLRIPYVDIALKAKEQDLSFLRLEFCRQVLAQALNPGLFERGAVVSPPGDEAFIRIPDPDHTLFQRLASLSPVELTEATTLAEQFRDRGWKLSGEPDDQNRPPETHFNGWIDRDGFRHTLTGDNEASMPEHAFVVTIDWKEEEPE